MPSIRSSLRQTLAACATALTLAAGCSARAENGVGAWSDLAPWPLIPIHAVMTTDGRILSYGTTTRGVQTGIFSYDVWNPAAGLGGGHTTLPNTTGVDTFCSAQMTLPQSRSVFLAGGDLWVNNDTLNRGNAQTLTFRDSGSTLTRGADMNRKRWYATITTLANGELYIQGGRDGEDLPEVRRLDGTMRLLTTAPTSSLFWSYPPGFLAPDGRVFTISDTAMAYVDTSGSGLMSGIGTLGGGTGGTTSSTAMFAPGRILRVGGRAGVIDATPTAPAARSAATIIDINGPLPVVTQARPMPKALHWATATVVPDGRVVVTGGATGNNVQSGVNDNALIWDPRTGNWTVGAASRGGKARLYHSVAVLLQDASILVGGGGAGGPQRNLNAEIYYPPYLLASDGSFLPRPRITTAPATLTPGQTFTLGVADAAAIRRVTLIKAPSVTHSLNMDQRFVELTFTRSAGGLRVTMPRRGSTTPPGLYMLFALDAAGVPSVARLVTVRATSASTLAVNWSPTFGASRSGTPFQLSCPSGQVLAGVHGTAGAKVTRVGPRCVAIDTATGAWRGSVVNGSAAGPTGGNAFSLTCPSGHAVNGFRGRSGSDVDALQLQCRKLAAGGALTGPPVYTARVGGNGGSSRPAAQCTTALAGRALYGRSEGTIQSFGVLCGGPTAALPLRARRL